MTYLYFTVKKKKNVMWEQRYDLDQVWFWREEERIDISERNSDEEIFYLVETSWVCREKGIRLELVWKGTLTKEKEPQRLGGKTAWYIQCLGVGESSGDEAREVNMTDFSNELKFHSVCIMRHTLKKYSGL
jgi:hypothetical protein